MTKDEARAEVERLRASAVRLIEESRVLEAKGEHADSARLDEAASQMSHEIVSLIERFNPFDGPELPEPIYGDILPDIHESTRGEGE